MNLEIPLVGDEKFQDLFVVIIIMIIAVFIAKIISIRMRRKLSGSVNKDRIATISKIIYLIIILIAFSIIFPILGLEVSGLLVAGGFLGIVIGFASQSVVSNLIAGIFLMAEKPIKIGDAVTIGDISGIVTDIKIMSTIVVKFDGIYVRIPNSTTFTSNIINYFANPVRRFEYTIGVRYSDDANKAIQIISNIIENEPLALKKPDPQVFVDSLGDNSVNIIVRIWAPSTQWYGLKMEMLWRMKTTLEENGIQVPFPQRTLWFANELKQKNSS